MAGKEVELKEAFEKYDKDQNGFVTLDEAFEVLKKELGYSKSNSDRLLKSCDINADGKLSYKEFITFFGKVQERKVDLVKAFNKMDADKNGFLTEEEVRAGLKDHDLTDADIRQLFKTCDTNNDGHLQLEEFGILWNE